MCKKTNIMNKLFEDGASLLFTSCKTDINIKLFYEYILHRFFNFPLKFKNYYLLLKNN